MPCVKSLNAAATVAKADPMRTGLEAMRLALDPATTENAGFLRENSALAIILLTDEDDCSARDPLLFDPEA